MRLLGKNKLALSSACHIILGATFQDEDATGCLKTLGPLCFCHFLGSRITYRGTSDLYSTALEICYILATKILKIDLEIAEIIEVKVGTRHLEIDIFAITQSPKNNFGVTVANFDRNYFSYL